MLRVGPLGLGVGIFMLVISWTAIASANSPAPQTYVVNAENNTVTICPMSFDTRYCPDGGVMLRLDVDTREAVELAGFCDSGECFVDECVPAGTYRYGFAEPFECVEEANTDYFSEVTVEDDLGDCTLNPENSGVTPFSGEMAWSDWQTRCWGHYESSEEDDGCRGVGMLSARVLGLNLLVASLALLILWRRRRTT